MDRYQRVEKKKPEAAINENEIRVTAQGRMRNYITYSMAKLDEEASNEIVIKAMGRAINKTVMIAELIKRRIVGLHQNTSIESADITDTWEPLEEGLLPLETTRHVSVIVITLSKKELDTSSSGYQSPLPPDQVKRLVEYDQGGELSPNVRGRGRGNRRRGRGRGRGNSNGVLDHGEYESWDAGRGYAGRGNGRGYRGRGRGRGRGYGGENGGGYGRGYGGESGGEHGREYGGENDGGYGTTEMHQESGEFEAPPPRGQGRGRGMVRGSGRGRNYRPNGSGAAQANA